ncbi:branched-chain amino acid aminotransferase [Streptomyces sp. NPDC088270]|uniref:branched-chain amino acid aminotransferase n=1 Tax=Streptomyces sp. NPDC088270 TaxID=3160990 RepID=UPI00341AF3EC
MSSSPTTIIEQQLKATRMPAEERSARMASPTFGAVFTEHMVTARYSEGRGWHSARVEPFGPLSMSPASGVLHYGQEIFEGLKAYRGPDDGVRLFRPECNARRFQESARRLAMPELPEALFLNSVCELVEVDHAWLPRDTERSLYLRPFMIASEPFIGLRPAREYQFGVIACPVGPVFRDGSAPLTVWVSGDHTRAAPGGTGAAKCGGNYAAAMSAHAQATASGCDQVVFLDAIERSFVDELGGMNVFFVFDDGSLVTPPLTGAILPGITRDSAIKLARASGHKVTERKYGIAEWRADAESGRLTEVFACGTAAAVAPIGRIRSADGEFQVADGLGGPVTTKLRENLLGIQYGRNTDMYGWTLRVR